jgi:hypothetical protein
MMAFMSWTRRHMIVIATGSFGKGTLEHVVWCSALCAGRNVWDEAGAQRISVVGAVCEQLL